MPHGTVLFCAEQRTTILIKYQFMHGAREGSIRVPPYETCMRMEPHTVPRNALDFVSNMLLGLHGLTEAATSGGRNSFLGSEKVG